jgi:polar amino acid transport system substrate-binding protein
MAPSASAAPLALLVFDRPPYYRLHDGHPAGGFLLDLARAVLDRAAIAYVVREMPPSRILATFEQHNVQACTVGWFKTSERETFARFSAPIYRNKPLVVALGVTSDACPPRPTLAQFVREKRRWGLRLGFSYGPAADAVFADLPEERVHRFPDAAHLLPLLAKGRVDAALIEPEEFSWLMSSNPEYAGSVRSCALADAPPGNERYIMCDASVPPEMLARIDAALGEYIGKSAEKLRMRLADRH